MKNRTTLYLILMVCVIAQAAAMRRTHWFPDIVLLVVVFAGTFEGWREAIMIGLAAGFLRGSMSLNTFFLDIFLFPAVGIISSTSARMFYRNNPLTQIFAVSVSILVVITSQCLYLNALSANDINPFFVLGKSWQNVLATIITAPLFFAMLKQVIGRTRH